MTTSCQLTRDIPGSLISCIVAKAQSDYSIISGGNMSSTIPVIRALRPTRGRCRLAQAAQCNVATSELFFRASAEFSQ